MLAVPDAPAAADWYRSALGATELWNLGSVIGMEICDDPDVVIARALQAGATGSLDHIRNHQMPWGTHRQGGFTDPFGHIWFVGDTSPLRPHPARN
jgi:uncharacterized glyoxalase superfamily protein PhnB